ncbi:hypothetical protein WA026_014868 [Henosepilachna vigintioctopunctata]|uniref:Uncharacterized protein n=1 Tax=Henosepilachna vigintioctopunctata TaxID=420089 RepID=A0AAW1UZZ6_9CUCU
MSCCKKHALIWTFPRKIMSEKSPLSTKCGAKNFCNYTPALHNFFYIRALAEKAINDVLFESSQGTLHRHSVKINEGFSYESSTVASPVDSVPQIASPQQQGFSSAQNDRLVNFFSGYE